MIDKNKLITELDKLDCISNINYYTNNCNSHDDIVNTIEEIYEAKLSAKEMFEELGFEYKKYNRGFAYEYDDGNKIKFIHFIMDRQTYCTNIYHVSTQLHNAITAQMKELGWI